MANYLDAAGLNQYTTALKNGTLKVGAAGAADSVPASGISGVIDLANLPAGALERMVVVADEAARLALTTANVQNGDTVKQTDTGILYFVKDDTKLGTADAAHGGSGRGRGRDAGVRLGESGYGGGCNGGYADDCAAHQSAAGSRVEAADQTGGVPDCAGIDDDRTGIRRRSDVGERTVGGDQCGTGGTGCVWCV